LEKSIRGITVELTDDQRPPEQMLRRGVSAIHEKKLLEDLVERDYI
jgi:hypothetical protein